MLLADGFGDAIIGVGERSGSDNIVVYDAEHCIKILVEGGMTYDEAHEYFSFNTLGAYVGENTPMFVWKMTEQEVYESASRQ
jgi:hypothetical protein